ncbi:hypothetical protein MPSEU_000044300 [Mayamaea pseudoterrestris]|nr:hypothetical protein MPSEU_000044300 [Mayamaea pseudoterrestris]
MYKSWEEDEADLDLALAEVEEDGSEGEQHTSEEESDLQVEEEQSDTGDDFTDHVDEASKSLDEDEEESDEQASLLENLSVDENQQDEGTEGKLEDDVESQEDEYNNSDEEDDDWYGSLEDWDDDDCYDKAAALFRTTSHGEQRKGEDDLFAKICLERLQKDDAYTTRSGRYYLFFYLRRYFPGLVDVEELGDEKPALPVAGRRKERKPKSRAEKARKALQYGTSSMPPLHIMRILLGSSEWNKFFPCESNVGTKTYIHYFNSHGLDFAVAATDPTLKRLVEGQLIGEGANDKTEKCDKCTTWSVTCAGCLAIYRRRLTAHRGTVENMLEARRRALKVIPARLKESFFFCMTRTATSDKRVLAAADGEVQKELRTELRRLKKPPEIDFDQANETTVTAFIQGEDVKLFHDNNGKKIYIDETNNVVLALCEATEDTKHELLMAVYASSVLNGAVAAKVFNYGGFSAVEGEEEVLMLFWFMERGLLFDDYIIKIRNMDPANKKEATNNLVKGLCSAVELANAVGGFIHSDLKDGNLVVAFVKEGETRFGFNHKGKMEKLAVGDLYVKFIDMGTAEFDLPNRSMPFATPEYNDPGQNLGVNTRFDSVDNDNYALGDLLLLIGNDFKPLWRDVDGNELAICPEQFWDEIEASIQIDEDRYAGTIPSGFAIRIVKALYRHIVLFYTPDLWILTELHAVCENRLSTVCERLLKTTQFLQDVAHYSLQFGSEREHLRQCSLFRQPSEFVPAMFLTMRPSQHRRFLPRDIVKLTPPRGNVTQATQEPDSSSASA